MKKILVILPIFLFIICLFAYLLITPSALAQQQVGLNLTLSPALLDLTANPGDIVKEKFRIRNNGDQTVALSIAVDKLDPYSTNGQVVPIAPQKNDPSTSWISFNTSSVSALPKEWTEIPFTITIPKTAAFGYYYAIRIGPGQSTNQQSGTTAKLLGQIVLPVLLTVQSPNAKAELKLLSFTTSSFFNEYLPVTFQAKFTNIGNIHVKPSGTIFIKTADGTASLDINPESGILLPGGTRTFATSWLDGFLVTQPVMEDGSPRLDKNGKVTTQLTINWNKLTSFRMGKYTATVLAVYDNGTRDVPLEATTTFWVFPYTFFGVVLISLVIFFFVVRFFLKWYVAQEVRKYKNN